MKIPNRYAAHVFGVIQATLTTGIATAIATLPMDGAVGERLLHWIAAWGLSWCTMLPVVIGVAPVIRRAVARLTATD